MSTVRVVLFFLILFPFIADALAQSSEDLRALAEASLAASPRLDHPHRPGSPPNPPGDDFVQGVPGDDLELTAVYPVSVTTGENGGYDLFNAVDPGDGRPGTDFVAHFYSGVNGRNLDRLGDRYLLGDGDQAFYLGRTGEIDDDFARILDLQREHATIVLHGVDADYRLIETFSPEAGTAIFHRDGELWDMIGFIADHVVVETTDPLFEYIDQPPGPGGPPWIEGVAQFGGANADLVLSVALDGAGVLYGIGVSRSDLAELWPEVEGEGRLFAVAHDAAGTRLWSTRFGSSENPDTDLAWTMARDGEALYVAGRSMSELAGGLKDAFVFKIDALSGQVLAHETWGGLGVQFAGAIALDDAEHVYVSGIGRDPNDPTQTDQDPYLEKRRRSDLALVERVFFGPGTNKEPWGGLAFHADGTGPGRGTIFSAGWTEENFGGPGFTGGDAWLVAFDDELELLWVEQWGSEDLQREWPWDLAVDEAGFVYVVGLTYGSMDGPGSQRGEGDGFVSKFDPGAPNGDRLLWTRHIGTSSADEPRRLCVVGDRIYVAGHTYGSFLSSPNAGLSDVWVAELDLDGQLLNVNQWGSEGDDRAFLAATPSTLLVGGVTSAALTGPPQGFLDGYFLRLDHALAPLPFADADGDGYLAGEDCAGSDLGAWALPGEVVDLLLTKEGGVLRLTWSPPEEPGGLDSRIRYDVHRSESAADLDLGAMCLASAIAPTSAEDELAGSPGAVLYYLVRATNACGAGPWGASTSGEPRSAQACP